MMPVRPQPEPPDFDERVRRRGQKWLLVWLKLFGSPAAREQLALNMECGCIACCGQYAHASAGGDHVRSFYPSKRPVTLME